MEKREKQINKLVDDFVVSVKKRHSALIKGDSRNANAQTKRYHKLFLAIVELGQEAREVLLTQIYNEDDYVATMAAIYSLRYSPEKSFNILSEMAKKPGFVGFEAQMAVKLWESGNWKLN